MPASLRFELTTPEIDDRPVFLSGNFCDWYPDLPAFQLTPVEPGRYALELPASLALPDRIEYKYTRGGWEHVELDAWAEVPPNRTTRRKTGVRRDEVPHWRWYGQAINPAYWPTLGLLDDAMPMPSRQTTRRVRVLLPHDYAHTDRRYPVLYLQDGQNLTGAGAGYGTWGVDRTMALLASQQQHNLILVLIDHGGTDRVLEFTPDRTLAGTGDGRRYLDFVVHQLKPRIDTLFRTQPARESTGLGGSSMGGLISLYGGLLHPAVFGRLLVFSPSLWVSRSAYADAAAWQVPGSTRLYLYGGRQETRYMEPSLRQLAASVQQSPAARLLQLQESINPTGRHNETFWGRAFPGAIRWLFFNP